MENNVYSQIVPSIFKSTINSANFFHVITSLFEVIILILILSWIVKKISLFKINKKNAYIKIIDKVSISSNESIVIIKVEKIKLILGITKNHITHLHTLSSDLKDDLMDEKKNILPIKKINQSLKYFGKK